MLRRSILRAGGATRRHHLVQSLLVRQQPGAKPTTLGISVIQERSRCFHRLQLCINRRIGWGAAPPPLLLEADEEYGPVDAADPAAPSARALAFNASTFFCSSNSSLISSFLRLMKAANSTDPASSGAVDPGVPGASSTPPSTSLLTFHLQSISSRPVRLVACDLCGNLRTATTSRRNCPILN